MSAAQRKSSLVVDTLATEAQHQIYENLSLFIRNFLPKYPQPDADAIENRTMAVIVDQKRRGWQRLNAECAEQFGVETPGWPSHPRT